MPSARDVTRLPLFLRYLPPSFHDPSPSLSPNLGPSLLPLRGACKLPVAASLLCFYSRWMSQSVRLCIRGISEHASRSPMGATRAGPRRSVGQREREAGEREQNGSSCAIPLWRGWGWDLQLTFLWLHLHMPTCGGTFEVSRVACARRSKLFNCVAHYLLLFLHISFSRSSRFREEAYTQRSAPC